MLALAVPVHSPHAAALAVALKSIVSACLPTRPSAIEVQFVCAASTSECFWIVVYETPAVSIESYLSYEGSTHVVVFGSHSVQVLAEGVVVVALYSCSFHSVHVLAAGVAVVVAFGSHSVHVFAEGVVVVVELDFLPRPHGYEAVLVEVVAVVVLAFSPWPHGYEPDSLPESVAELELQSPAHTC